jgi:hypothetical protein
LNFNLFRNRLALAKMGIDRIPVIISQTFLQEQKEQSNFCPISGSGESCSEGVLP